MKGAEKPRVLEVELALDACSSNPNALRVNRPILPSAAAEGVDHLGSKGPLRTPLFSLRWVVVAEVTDFATGRASDRLLLSLC